MLPHGRTLLTLTATLGDLLWAATMALRSPQGSMVRAYTSISLPSDCPVGHNSWVDFLGQASTLDGQLLPVGAVVRAYDPTGLLVGCSEVGLSGWYLISVYGDDVTTPEPDGAAEGASIAFTVNGHQAVPLGPDVPVWTKTSPGGDERVDVELRACTLTGDFDCNCRVDVGDIQRVAGRWGVLQGQQSYYPPYDPDGDGIDAGDIQWVTLNWRGTCQ